MISPPVAKGGEQYLSYHLHCERHYDRQMTEYNVFVKMSPRSKFTKPLQYGHCPSQCLSSHRFKALILDKAVYVCELHAPAKTNSTHQQHSVRCESFGSHIDSTCKHNELIDHNNEIREVFLQVRTQNLSKSVEEISSLQ